MTARTLAEKRLIKELKKSHRELFAGWSNLEHQIPYLIVTAYRAGLKAGYYKSLKRKKPLRI